MNKKLVCMFSGWFEIDVDDVVLLDPQSNVSQTASQWLKEKGSIDGLILDSFNDANAQATDGTFEQLDLSVEDA